MQTGIKAVDQLIEKHGLLRAPGQDAFQRRLQLVGGDKRAEFLPFCMYQKVMYAPMSKHFTVHHFYLPARNAKLASFLFDEKGQLIEQVYYQKVAKMVNVCRKLHQLLVKQTHEVSLAA
ncbi:hypothetical protein [Alteromonas sp. A079]|uniref:hypothetical protein n=1 Tax=Alteromonas sp. A079 TaxID=3410268 RepID=UPI003B9E0A5A